MLGSSSGGVFPEFVVPIYFVRPPFVRDFFLKNALSLAAQFGAVTSGGFAGLLELFCLSLSVLVKNSCMFFHSSNFVSGPHSVSVFSKDPVLVFLLSFLSMSQHVCHTFLSILYELNSLLGLGSFLGGCFLYGN